MNELTLICPGLLGPVPTAAVRLPRVPTLDRLAARADWVESSAPSAAATLLRACGLRLDPDAEIPTAALSLLGEGHDEDPRGYWLHADPVHLRPDRERLLVFAGASLAPQRAEAEALVALFNAHFADEGLRLIAPHPERWYLHSERPLDLRAEPLASCIGRPIPLEMARGDDARRWSALMVETQMLFHGAEVNRRREQTGRPSISGIWTWGGGPRPEPPGTPPDVLAGAGPLVAGLARWCGIARFAPDPWSLAPTAMSGRCVLFWDALERALEARDIEAWTRALVTLDARLAELIAGPWRGRDAELHLDPCAGGLFQARRTSWRRFWRRGGLAERLHGI